MKSAVTVEQVINPIVEVAGVAIGIKEVDRVTSVGSVFHVRPVAELQRHIDDDIAALPHCAAVVRKRIGRLEAGIKAAKEVIEPTAAVVFGLDAPTQQAADSAAVLLRAAYANALECADDETDGSTAAAPSGLLLFYGPSVRMDCLDAEVLPVPGSPSSAQLVVSR